MFPRAALVLLNLLVATIVAIFVLAELVAPHSTWHFEPMVSEMVLSQEFLLTNDLHRSRFSIQ